MSAGSGLPVINLTDADKDAFLQSLTADAWNLVEVQEQGVLLFPPHKPVAYYFVPYSLVKYVEDNSGERTPSSLGGGPYLIFKRIISQGAPENRAAFSKAYQEYQDQQEADESESEPTP